MAKQMMKYKLNTNGTIPSFLYLGKDGVGGMWPNGADTGTPPQDTWLVGISDGSTLPAGQTEIIDSKENLLTYLNSFTSNWMSPQGTEPSIPFNQQEAADWAWAKLEALNLKSF